MGRSGRYPKCVPRKEAQTASKPVKQGNRPVAGPDGDRTAQQRAFILALADLVVADLLRYPPGPER